MSDDMPETGREASADTTVPEAIIQADREAAAAVVEWHNHAASQWEVTAESTTLQFFLDSLPARMREGAFDEHDLVQAFARHRRLTPHSAGEGLREALERIVQVGTRTTTVRVGDMYDEQNGYDDVETVSEEAEIAAAALAEDDGR